MTYHWQAPVKSLLFLQKKSYHRFPGRSVLLIIKEKFKSYQPYIFIERIEEEEKAERNIVITVGIIVFSNLIFFTISEVKDYLGFVPWACVSVCVSRELKIPFSRQNQ